ncbi:MAG: N-formylglutamate deformylase [Candidatus Sericytochromatia bacterium]
MDLPYTLHRGHLPILISMPHTASDVPPEIASQLLPGNVPCPDTDWEIDRLYDFAGDMGLSVLIPHWSRYAIDLNRPPDDTNLYPGADTTGLCPVSRFDRSPLYLQNPDAAEISRRRTAYWEPYHAALQAESQRLRDLHGQMLIYDAHSIASVVPRFFAGELPVLNLGTAGGSSCAPSLEALICDWAAASGTSWVLNGRFKGGYITRAYARPETGIHSFQLELAQRCYRDEAQGVWHPERAPVIQTQLARLLHTLVDGLRTLK